MGASRWKKNIVAVISQDRVIDDKFKRQIKNEFFNILAIGQKYLSIYPPSFFNIHIVITSPNFSRKIIFQLIAQFYMQIRLKLPYLSFLVHLQL